MEIYTLEKTDIMKTLHIIIAGLCLASAACTQHNTVQNEEDNAVAIIGVGSVCLGSPIRFLRNAPKAMEKLELLYGPGTGLEQVNSVF